MLELKGKYNQALVFTDLIESEAISQIIEVLNRKAFEESLIRIMPDVHSGAGCTIGTTMTIKDKVVPNLVGVDIGCGVLVTKIKEKNIDVANLDRVIREFIPSGFDVHDKKIHKEAYDFMDNIEMLKCYKNAKMNPERVVNSIGTLGGGNHFIALERDEESIYLIIHSGSRNLGTVVANYYQDIAIKNLENRTFDFNSKKKELIVELKRAGKEREINSELQKLSKSKPILSQIEQDLAYIEKLDLTNYLHDIKICQEYATLNRKCMAKIILEKCGLNSDEQFETIHNYIDLNRMILRKGAVSSNDGEKLIIPVNMRDGSIIAIGKGNPNWNYSAPHGAGRLMSRKKAKEVINIDDFRISMEGIYSTSVNEHTIDESPFAYKPMEEILLNIKDTVEVISFIKPIYNYKDSTKD